MITAPVLKGLRRKISRIMLRKLRLRQKNGFLIKKRVFGILHAKSKIERKTPVMEAFLPAVVQKID